MGAAWRVTRPTIVPVVPRVLNAATLCAYLGRSESWFAEHRAELETQGFPTPVSLLGGYDRHAVDLWLDQRSGLLRIEGPMIDARSWDKPTARLR
jgi:predicted DNA-binding transcriptional regulator AlpA